MNATDKEHTVRLFTNGGYFLTSRRDGNFGAVTVTEISQASFNPSLLKVVACPTSTVFHSLAGWHRTQRTLFASCARPPDSLSARSILRP